MKSFLTADKKDRGIYLLGNDFGYAGYETFKQGVQDAGDFIEGGLARVLEASQNPKALKEVSSKKNYPRGVNVWGFDYVSAPLLRVAALGSNRDDGRRLSVDGNDWDDVDGYAFGVLK